MKTIVSNTSPLILLSKIGRLEVLLALYEHIMVPQAVVEEISVQDTLEYQQIHTHIRQQRFSVHNVQPAYSQRVTVHNLDKGESDAIALALEKNADLIILDDKKGRSAAKSVALAVTGTLGVLLQAQLQGIITDIAPELEKLRAAGMWLHPKLYQKMTS